MCLLTKRASFLKATSSFEWKPPKSPKKMVFTSNAHPTHPYKLEFNLLKLTKYDSVL